MNRGRGGCSSTLSTLSECATAGADPGFEKKWGLLINIIIRRAGGGGGGGVVLSAFGRFNER